jgi:hypothetical protein
MKGKPRLGELQEFPRRELLEALARHYHHLQNEHKRAGPGSRVRRRIEDQMSPLRERFEQVLAEWVPEPELQDAWRKHLNYRAPEPPGPPAVRPLVFRGISEANSVVEIRERGEELEVTIDGALVDRIVGEKDFAAVASPLRYRPNRTDFEEIFSASEDALEALADFVADDGPPPWNYASELLSDGLIDTNAALTPRGRRALAARHEHR